MYLNFWNVLCTLVCVGLSEALRQGDTGVCVIQKNVLKTKAYSTVVMVPCRNGRSKCSKRVAKKENYFEKEAADGCCDGFEYVEETDSCQPACLHGCDGGKCVAPDVCVCEPPLILVINKCIPPVCDNPCVNGNCTSPNTCTCNEGYQLKDDNFTCAAQCTNCDNGECTAPNECKCNKGFTMIENKCTPVCKNECSNGFCSSPDVCSCNDGYKSENNTCKPICSKVCVGGTCVAPDICECLSGYEPKAGSKEVCQPKCESCANGECIAPNVCFCHKGYALADNACKPTCKDSCVNGHCTAPNECTCSDGYKRNATEPSICYKPCSACNFGTCNLEGECICDADFKLVNGTCLSLPPKEAFGMESTPGLAGLEMSWLVGGALGVLLVVLVIVVINRIWRRRMDAGPKAAAEVNTYGSVVYTLPDTLIRHDAFTAKHDEDLHEPDTDDQTSEKLMPKQPNDIV